MDSIRFTPGDVMAFCNMILVFAAVGALIMNTIKKANAPNERQDEKLKELEKRLDGHERRFSEIGTFLKRDKERLDEIESVSRVTNRVIIQTLQVLVRHGINGNNKDELIEADRELNKYLLNSQWGHENHYVEDKEAK